MASPEMAAFIDEMCILVLRGSTPPTSSISIVGVVPPRQKIEVRTNVVLGALAVYEVLGKRSLRLGSGLRTLANASRVATRPLSELSSSSRIRL